MTQVLKHQQDSTALESAETIHELENRFALAIRQRDLLEGYIRERLKPDKHFYKIAGSNKPSLTKEGAELVSLPHGLKPMYFQYGGPTDPPAEHAPYQISVRCRLMRGEIFCGEGLGSASSYITTREGVRKPRQTDIGLCHNATLKMAQKSAYIAATLNATAASEFFTQDLEDDQGGEIGSQRTPPDGVADKGYGICPEHNVAWFKTEKMRAPAHPKAGGWCNKPAEKPAPPPAAENDMTKFFTLAKSLGVDPKTALGYLNVADWNEWVKIGGSLEQASTTLRAKAPIPAKAAEKGA